MWPLRPHLKVMQCGLFGKGPQEKRSQKLLTYKMGVNEYLVSQRKYLNLYKISTSLLTIKVVFSAVSDRSDLVQQKKQSQEE